MSRKLVLGQVIHHVKELDWGCGRIEAMGYDWAVLRSEYGTPALVNPSDSWETEHIAHNPCSFFNGEGDNESF